MKKPLVSVVLPSYNHERFVAQAIASVFAQTFTDLELIVVDDGSRDSSRDVIRRALAKKPRGFQARVFERENSGAHAAISFGLEQARGRFLTILNSDDYYHPERIEALVKLAHGCEAELLFSMVEMVSESGDPLTASVPEVLWYHEAVSLRHYLPTLGFGLIRDNLAVTTGNLFFSRSLYARVGPFRAFKYAHDADFVLRALPFTEPKLLSRKLLYYRLHGNNTIRAAGPGIDAEGRQILATFMAAALDPAPKPNRFAPCPAQWPRYFNRFIAQERPFFGESRIIDYLEESADQSVRPSSREPAGAAQQFQAAPSLTGVNVHLLDRARVQAAPFTLHSGHIEEHWISEGSSQIGQIGVRFRARLIPSAGVAPKALAMVHEDRILSTARPGPGADGLIECAFVIGTEFAHLDLREAVFLSLEGAADPGYRLHAGAKPVLAPRLDWGSGPRLEPTRAYLGDQAYEIRAAAFDGKIERARRLLNGDVVIEGWAADPVSREALTGVLLFDGERWVSSKYESRFRRPAEGAAERSGFRLLVPASSCQATRAIELRAIAIFRRGIALSLGQVTVDPARSECVCRLAWRDPSSGPIRAIERTSSGWRLRDSQNDHAWSLCDGTLGFVDHLSCDSFRGIIAGWSVDRSTGLVPQAYLLCDGDRPFALLKANWERRDIAKAYSLREPLVAGFWLDLAREGFPASLRAFALWDGGSASEIPIYKPKTVRAKPRELTAPGTA